MSYVCTQLSKPSALTGVQTCTSWQELVLPQPTNILGLPPLTPDQLHDLSITILYVCAVAWGFRVLGKLISSMPKR